MFLHQEQVKPQSQKSDRRKYGHVDRVETRQRGSCHFVATFEHAADEGSDQGHGRHDLRAHPRREVRELVPRQQVTGEAEAHGEPQQHDARDPCDLARRPVGLQKQHAEEVQEGREDHQVGRPVVDRANEPAELHLGHQELDRLVRVLGARSVVEEQKDTGDHLNEEEEESHPPQIIPEGVPVDGDFFLLGELADLGKTQTFVEPGPKPADPLPGGRHVQAPLLTTI